MRIKNDELKRLVGYAVGKEMRLLILQAVKNEGITIQEAASRYNIGSIAVLDDDGKFLYEGNRITPEEWSAINPLKEFGKIVILTTQRQEKLKT